MGPSKSGIGGKQTPLFTLLVSIQGLYFVYSLLHIAQVSLFLLQYKIVYEYNIGRRMLDTRRSGTGHQLGSFVCTEKLGGRNLLTTVGASSSKYGLSDGTVSAVSYSFLRTLSEIKLMSRHSCKWRV